MRTDQSISGAGPLPGAEPAEVDDLAGILQRAEHAGIDPRRVLIALGLDPGLVEPPISTQPSTDASDDDVQPRY